MKKLSFFLLMAFFIASPALADKVLEQKTKLLGKEFSVKEQLGSVVSGNGVNESTRVKFLGKSIPLLTSKIEYTNNNGKIENRNNELYVNGIKVWTGSGTSDNKGSYSYTGGIAPTQIGIPVFSYTVGPLALEVNAGVAFEGSMQAKLYSPLLVPDLSTVVTADSLVDASLNTNASASGYVEALARVLIVQAGLGGNVGLVDGNAAVSASIPVLDPSHPLLTYDGKLQVLNGKIYAFVDYRKLGGWKRWLNHDLYSWNGKCWSMGAQACVTTN